MTVAYFDCFSGICGDMILGALVNLGVSKEFLKKELKKLNFSDYEIEIKTVEENHISATDVYIIVKNKQHHRSLKDINNLLDNSTLDLDVKELSKNIFLKLAKAESKIHNVKIDKVHFHEVGAVDSIIDIVGSVILFKKLGIDEAYCSPLPLGSGFVKCAHGLIPIPAPATVELLKDVPVYSTDRKQELVTPTGAAIVTSFTKKFGDMPLMKIDKIGYGAGKTKSDYPNLLRVFIGKKVIKKRKKN